MKPINFRDRNIKFAEKQKEYQTLPALKIPGPEGAVISCWRLSFKERLKVLFAGRVWLNLLTFNQNLTPSNLSTNRKDFYMVPRDKEPGYKQFISWIKYQISLVKNYFKMINDRAKAKLNNLFK